MDTSDSITYEITKTGNILRKLVMKRLQAIGVDLSPEESVLMNRLWDKSEMALSELAEWSVKEPSTLSRQVDGLVRKGYINRRESSLDRRSQLVSVSDKGWEIRNQFLKAELHLIDGALVSLSERDRKTVLRSLKLIRENALDEICRAKQ